MYCGIGLCWPAACDAPIEAGFKVTGYDVDEQKIEALKGGTSYISHRRSLFPSLQKGGARFHLIPRVSSADVIILCLPTPLGAL